MLRNKRARLEIGMAQSGGGEVSSTHAEKLRILVVDDNDLMRTVMKRFLQQEGHIVEAAADGKSAFALFESGEFDLVITDLEMAGMRGDALATAIRNRVPRQPIIMMTGNRPTVEAGLAGQRDVDYLLAKPFTLEALSKAIRNILARDQQK